MTQWNESKIRLASDLFFLLFLGKTYWQGSFQHRSAEPGSLPRGKQAAYVAEREGAELLLVRVLQCQGGTRAPLFSIRSKNSLCSSRTKEPSSRCAKVKPSLSFASGLGRCSGGSGRKVPLAPGTSSYSGDSSPGQEDEGQKREVRQPHGEHPLSSGRAQRGLGGLGFQGLLGRGEAGVRLAASGKLSRWKL